MDVADSGKRYLYLQNTLFSVTGLVDASNGALVEAYAYDPYGASVRFAPASGQAAITDFDSTTLTTQVVFNPTTPSTVASLFGNPYLFTGQRFDPETGLYSYKERYYDCGVGRFVSRDPIGYTDGAMNLYQYAKSAPVRYVDFSGFIEWEIGDNQRHSWIFDNDDTKWGSVNPSSSDYAFWQQEWAMANGGYLAGWPDAASAYLHYLENSGSDFGWNGSQMIKTSWSSRWGIAIAMAEATAYAKNVAEGLITGLQEMPSGNPIIGDGEVKVDRNDKNWNLALGSFFIRGNGVVSCSDFGYASLKSATITIEMADRYNFHMTPNPSQSKLETVGLARSYNRYGGSVTLTFPNLYADISISKIDEALLQGKSFY